eukprot:610983-Rhodomonas_salina.1
MGPLGRSRVELGETEPTFGASYEMAPDKSVLDPSTITVRFLLTPVPAFWLPSVTSIDVSDCHVADVASTPSNSTVTFTFVTPKPDPYTTTVAMPVVGMFAGMTDDTVGAMNWNWNAPPTLSIPFSPALKPRARRTKTVLGVSGVTSKVGAKQRIVELSVRFALKLPVRSKPHSVSCAADSACQQ